MTVPVLLQPKPQFCDANGKPYAGGFLFTTIKGTNTFKATWKDPDQAALNTNPIVLDAAGQCDMWGDGDYQLTLYDALNNLIWSVPSTTVVSAAMYPVVSAPTTLDARNAMGIADAINAAVGAEATERAAQDAALKVLLDDETAERVAQDIVQKAYTDAETTERVAQDTGLQAQILALSGSPVEVAHGGAAVLTFGIGTNFATADITFPPFASATHAVVVTPADVLFTTVGGFSNVIFNITNLTSGGARINATGLGGTAAAAFNTTVYWVATGS